MKKEIKELVDQKPPTSKKVKSLSLSNFPKRLQSKDEVVNLINEFSKLRDNWNDEEVIDIKW
jgi:hypothetical protein